MVCLVLIELYYAVSRNGTLQQFKSLQCSPLVPYLHEPHATPSSPDALRSGHYSVGFARNSYDKYLDEPGVVVVLMLCQGASLLRYVPAYRDPVLHGAARGSLT